MSNTPQATTTPPPLESSQEFQDRTQQALGGKPVHPAQFRPAGKPEPLRAVKPDSLAMQSRVMEGLNEAPEILRMRDEITALRDNLLSFISSLDAGLVNVTKQLEALKPSKHFKTQANKMDFNTKSAQGLIADLAAVLDKYAPRTSPTNEG